MQTYIVKQGDTLYGISNQFGVSVADIKRINNVDENNLKIGSEIKIPSISGVNPDATFTYTVKKGDSLYSIARKYNTTVDELLKLNNLKSALLSIGQNIIVPVNYQDDNNQYVSYMTYTVKKGDTLYSIASLYDVDVSTIKKDNSLDNNTLQIGQILKIRTTNSEITETIMECFGEDYVPVEVETTIYIVKKGDSLYSIANKFNTSVNEIKKLNNLGSNILNINQSLKIPINNSEVKYIVKKGDSLYSIANKFNTSVDNIKKKNKLNSNILQIGQSLII